MPRQAPMRARHALTALAALGLAAAGAGCSAVKTGQNDDLVAGKKMFVAKCSSCHTLARANAKGVVGPNLDEAFGPSIQQGLKRNTVRGVVSDQIRFPERGGAMPANLVHGQAVANVAAYVAYAAGRSGADSGLLATAISSGPGKAVTETNGQLEIDADPTGQLKYTAGQATAKAGAATIVMKNASGVQHNIAVESGNGGATPAGSVVGQSAIIANGQTQLKLTLKPGTYTFFCQVDGHRAAGMYGTLTVK